MSTRSLIMAGKRSLIAAGLLVLVPVLPGSAFAPLPATAQGVDPQLLERARAALAPLAGLVGQWEGEVNAMTGPGTTMTVHQSEDIAWGASQTVIIIRGTGRSVQGAAAGSIVFEAAGIIWYDAESDRVRMRTHRDGATVEPTVVVGTDSLTWSFDVPGGRVEYVIAFTADTWHETGHFMRDGAPPVRIIEMRLRRTE